MRGTGWRLTRAIRSGTTSSSAYAPFSSGSRFSHSVCRPRAHCAHVPHGAEFAATTRLPVATSKPQNSWPNGDGSSDEQQRMPAPERLQVGAVGERDLDLHEHVAASRLRIGHVLDAQVAGPVEARGSHGVNTTLAPAGS